MKKYNRALFAIALTSTLLLGLLSGCASFKAERVDDKTADDRAMKVTDKWVNGDTILVIDGTIKKIYEHARFKSFQSKKKKENIKVFVAEIQNNTSEAYFPIKDLEDALLEKLSNSETFLLIDASAREKLLKELQYQNDGSVDPAQSKKIGKQAGADLMIMATVNMKPETRDGKTVKSYSVNFRLTDVETAEEVCRTREVINKYSEQSGSSW
ncbi:MAG: CsgG/HfaB family protein [Bdellovibrionota bacterium]